MRRRRRKTGREPRGGASLASLPGFAQMKALSHPLRVRLLELFGEPRTTKQAAEKMGEAPTRLYHHVAALEKAGLIRLKETRPNRGTTEKYFQLVKRRIIGGDELVRALRRKGRRRELAAMSFVLFDRARNELLHALTHGGDHLPEGLTAVRASLRLSPAGARKLQKELMRVIRKRARKPGARARAARANLRHHSLTIALIPIEEESG